MKKYNQFDLPFATSNMALAFCFYISGIPFADENQPLTNNYDAEVLRHLKYPKGTDIESAVADAVTKRKAGRVHYGFAYALRMPEAQQGFDEARKAEAGSAHSARFIVGEIMGNHAAGFLSQTSALAGAAAVILKRWREELKEWSAHSSFRDTVQKIDSGSLRDADARETAEQLFLSGDFHAFAACIMETRNRFMDLSFRNPAWIHIRHKGQSQSLADGRTKHPGFVTFSTNAEQETRKALGVPRK